MTGYSIEPLNEEAHDPMNPSSRHTCLALLLSGCLFWTCSLLAAEGAPTVVLDPAGTMQLGNVVGDEVRHITFKVVNKTDKPITVTALRATCSCTVAKEPPADPVPPGGSVELSLDLSAAKVADGLFERSATVLLAGAPMPFIMFHFQGNKVQPIEIHPGRQIQLPPAKTPDEAWESKVQITGNLLNGQQLRLDKPVAGERLLAEMKETAPSAYEVTVRPKLPQAMGQYSEEIKIPVLEPKDLAPIILRGNGQVGAVLSVSGGTVKVWKGTAGQPAIKTLSLYQLLPVAPSSPGGMSPRTWVPSSEVTVKTPPGVTAVVQDVQKRTRLTLTFSPDLPPDTRGIVEIQTKCCGNASVNFVVMGDAGKDTRTLNEKK